MLINELPKYMLVALVLTEVLELSGALALGVRKRCDLLAVALASLATNPVVVSVSMAFGVFKGADAYYISLAVLEVSAVLVEGLIYLGLLNYKKINPFLLSLILNAFSYISGIFINRIIY